MSGMPKRQKRKKSTNAKRGRGSWTDEEIAELLRAIRLHGHKNVEEILKAIPSKTKNDYHQFLRCARKIAIEDRRKGEVVEENLLDWISMCESQYCQHKLSRNGSLELASLLELLAIDGVCENHPLPEDAGGVDYASCYRLLHQAVLGHPIQAVSKETAQTIFEILNEVIAMSENKELIDKLKETLKKFTEPVGLPESNIDCIYNVALPKKSVKVYERKKNNGIKEEPSLNQIQGTKGDDLSLPSTSKGNEIEILKDIGLNPLQLPAKLLYNTNLLVGSNNK